MRKIAFICIVAGGLASGWNAAVGASYYNVGVPLDPTSCSENQQLYDPGIAEWGVDCPYSQNSISATVSILGLGLCAGPGDSLSVGTVADKIYTTTSGENVFCWCRMYSPWLSKWVLAARYVNNETVCVSKCNTVCADVFLSNSTFRSAITDALFNAVSL